MSLPTEEVEPMPIALRSRRTTASLLALATTVLATGLVVLAPASAAPAAAAPAGAVFQAVAPTRLADTRREPCGCTRIDATTIRVSVLGRPGIPADTTAVALSLTVSGTTAIGYATAWPSGQPMPGTSNINWTAGQTRANGAILAVGAGGSIDVFVSSATEIIVDITGAFTAAAGAAAAGRYNSVAPARLLDTRSSGSRVPSGSTLTVALPAGVPADATALAATITVVDSVGWGYVVAYPAGTPRPDSSVVNTDHAGQTRAATAIVPVTAGGLSIYVDGASHVLVDVYGWFSGASSAPSTNGMFVSNPPLRVWDTRGFNRIPVWAGGTMEIGPTDQASAELWAQLAQASSLVFNLTISEPATAGWMTAYPARTARPGTSTINWATDETVANLAISPWSTAGVAYFAYGETDILVDVTGYFTGSPTPGSLAKAANTSPGYVGEPARDLVYDSVPASVFAVLGGVDMATLPDLGGPAGYASTPPEVIRFAYQIYNNRRRIVARSTAAHEVGHILAYRYIAQTGNGIFWSGDDHECIAEALGRIMTAWTGRGYSPGYGGRYDSCAVSPLVVATANDILATQT